MALRTPSGSLEMTFWPILSRRLGAASAALPSASTPASMLPSPKAFIASMSFGAALPAATRSSGVRPTFSSCALTPGSLPMAVRAASRALSLVSSSLMALVSPPTSFSSEPCRSLLVTSSLRNASLVSSDLAAPSESGQLVGQTLERLGRQVRSGSSGVLDGGVGTLPVALRGSVGRLVELGQSRAGLLERLGSDAQLGELVLDLLRHLVQQLLAQLGGQLGRGLHGLLEVSQGALHVARLQLLEGVHDLRSGLARRDEVLRRQADLLELRLDARIVADGGEGGVASLVVGEQLLDGGGVAADELLERALQVLVGDELLEERVVGEQGLGSAERVGELVGQTLEGLRTPGPERQRRRP